MAAREPRMPDSRLHASAAAGQLTASGAEVSKEINSKMSEAKRLLTLMGTTLDGWSKEEAAQGIGTMHGPKVIPQPARAQSAASARRTHLARLLSRPDVMASDVLTS